MNEQRRSPRGQPGGLNLERLTSLTGELRREVLKMTTEAESGHPSSSFSAVEILTALYFGDVLRFDPQRPDWPERDRFIMSKGHAAPILYAVLAEAGYFPKSELMTLRKLGSPLEGHPNMSRLAGVEASTGSLGQGLSIGLGHALAARYASEPYNVFVLLGDGEIEQGQVWEAAMSAANYNVSNLIGIVDNNGYQQTTAVSNLTDPTMYDDKWRAFGWETVEVDGHNLEEVHQALLRGTEHQGGPFMIIAHTVKGKGLEFMEKDFTWHGRAVPEKQLAEALEELA